MTKPYLILNRFWANSFAHVISLLAIGLLAIGLLATATVQADTGANFFQRLALAAETRTQSQVTYDGRYVRIPYPNGDVPANIGVCTDVVIRTYRKLGIDLQQRVHEDMRSNFAAYPSRRIWGLKRTDTNIDHRRVPNLQTFFKRHGESLPITRNPRDYQPGDIVTWIVPKHLPHIGIVSTQRDATTAEPLIVHNIGAGPMVEKMLFDFKITGHYRYRLAP